MSKKCIYCGSELNEEAIFCSKCGKSQTVNDSVELKCSQCGSSINKTDEFCSSCGTRNINYENNGVPKNLKELLNYTFNPNSKNKINGIEVWRKQFLNFNGRLNREDYILKGIFISAIMFIMGAILEMYVNEYYMDAIDYVLCLIGFIVLILVVVSGISLSVRRCHDLDKSGIWVLLCFVPIINFIFSLYLLFMRGTIGPNKYGEDLVKD